MDGSKTLSCRVTAICKDRVKTVLCLADDQYEESVCGSLKELFEFGLAAEFFKDGLKIVIDVAPVDQPHLMHDPRALFIAFRGGELKTTLGGIVTQNTEDGIREGDEVNHRGAVEEQLFAEDIGRSFHSLENSF